MRCVKYPRKAIITVGKPDAYREIHIGHLAGGFITSDIFARFLRNRIGCENVLFVSATECYGTAVYQEYLKKQEDAETINEYIYSNHLKQKEILERFQISLNEYCCDLADIELGTIHRKLCQKFIDDLVSGNNVLCKSEKILIDSETGSFLNYRQVELNEEQKTSTKRTKYDVDNVGKMISVISGKRPCIREVENYFFILSKRQKNIIELHRKKYCELEKYLKNVFSFCDFDKSKKDLDAIRLTCNSDLGVDVQIDDKNKKIWNWIDSLIAPISYTMYHSFKNKKEFSDWKKWWCEEEAEIYHFIAQDNVFFYMVIELYLILSWNDSNKDKINYPNYVITPMRTIFNGKYTGQFPTGKLLLEKYNVEALRYSIASMGNRNSSFNPEKLVDESLKKDNIDFKYNAILKKINRLTSMAEAQMKDVPQTIFVPLECIEAGKEIFEKYEEIMMNQEFSKAVDLIEEKFKTFLNDEENILYNAKLMCVMLYPFLPKTIEEKYRKIYGDLDLYENYNFENQKIEIRGFDKEIEEYSI